jgi:predicted Zn-dependent peptidase
MHHHCTRLGNGIVVLSAPMPHMASVSIGLWVRIGGRYEPAELNGASHFIEHLLFKGTARRSARDISQAVEGLGGYLNAFTGEEHTCFYSRAHADHAGEVLDVLFDMFQHSRFDPAEVDKERNVIKEELAMYNDQPQHHVQELLNQLLWPEQPLGRPLTGTERTLDFLTRERLVAFHRANYVAPATVIAAAGNLNHDRLVRQVARLSRRFNGTGSPAFAPVQERQSQPRLRLAVKPTEQTQIALGIRTCSRHDPRRYALRLWNTMLGENMSSRLFQSVREERGLAYAIHSTLSYFDDTGDLVVSAGLDAGQAAPALKLILTELRRFTRTLPPRLELQRAKDYIIGQLDLSLESTENQMMWLGEQWLGYGRLFQPGRLKQLVRAVTPSQVRSVAQTFFRPERMSLALVSSLKSDRALRSILGL